MTRWIHYVTCNRLYWKAIVGHSLPSPTFWFLLFCFNDWSNVWRLALAKKIEKLSWKFVGNLLFGIATKNFFAIWGEFGEFVHRKKFVNFAWTFLSIFKKSLTWFTKLLSNPIISLRRNHNRLSLNWNATLDSISSNNIKSRYLYSIWKIENNIPV